MSYRFFSCGGSAAISDVVSDGRPDPENLLIGAKAAALSKLAYLKGEEENRLIEALALRDFKEWFVQLHTNDELPSKGGVLTKMVGHSLVESDNGARAITAVLSNITDKLTGDTLVVCFRGASCSSESLTNFNSFRPSTMTSEKGNVIGITGGGLLKAYQKLAYNESLVQPADSDSVHRADENLHTDKTVRSSREYVSLLKYVVAHAPMFENGVLICGHSLGGRMSALLAAELQTDYPDRFHIRLVTFGSPRVFDHDTAIKMHCYPYALNLRFMNEGDFVANIGGQEFLSTFGYNVLEVISIFLRLRSVHISDHELCKDEDIGLEGDMELLDMDDDDHAPAIRFEDDSHDALFSTMIATAMKTLHSQSMKANLLNLANPGTKRKIADNGKYQVEQRNLLLKAVGHSIRKIHAQSANGGKHRIKKDGPVRFYHSGIAIYLEGKGSSKKNHAEKNGFTTSAGVRIGDARQLELFDWTPKLKGTTLTEGAALYSFLRSGIDRHRMNSEEGYFHTLCSSAAFQAALASDDTGDDLTQPLDSDYSDSNSTGSRKSGDNGSNDGTFSKGSNTVGNGGSSGNNDGRDVTTVGWSKRQSFSTVIHLLADMRREDALK